MKTLNKVNPSRAASSLLQTKVILLGGLSILSNQIVAQTDSLATDSVKNKTIKSVFGEMKKIAGKEDSMLLTVLGITAVVSVVVVAMYLSFKKSPGEDEEAKNKYNFARKTTRRR